MPLSDEARAWAIEKFLSINGKKRVERIVRQCRTEDDAIFFLRLDSEICGYGGVKCYFHCTSRGIEGRARDGTQGVISWREIVRYARAEAQQLALPMES